MRFEIEGGAALSFAPTAAVVAGWTGRDPAKVAHHIAELAALGVPPPSATPLYYRVSAALLTQDDAIEALGEQTSGEAEPVLIRRGGALWPLDALGEAFDALELRCWLREAGGWRLYQEGTLAALRPLRALEAGCPLPEGGVMFCGTLGAIGGVRPAPAWRMALRDPARDREIALEYAVRALPVVA